MTTRQRGKTPAQISQPMFESPTTSLNRKRIIHSRVACLRFASEGLPRLPVKGHQKRE